jgi:hypothetical protein
MLSYIRGLKNLRFRHNFHQSNFSHVQDFKRFFNFHTPRFDSVFKPLKDSFSNFMHGRVGLDQIRHLTIHDWITLFRRRMVLIHGMLVQTRHIEATIAGIKISFKTNISNVCGHISFIFLAFSYLETDFLNLRLHAVSGTEIISYKM